ncbi:MAG: hypothetical protein M3N54_14250 [Acidobacteriota bacterium]|nr:hypothetical protein [Acidobacteriota bacterium]
MAASEPPALSVVVAIVSDTTGRLDVAHLGPCLAALKGQIDGPPLEIVVPYHPSLEGIAGMREQHPDVRFHEIADLRTFTGKPGSREHHDELRARGLGLASGAIVALIEDHGIAAPDWSARIAQAHAGAISAAGGAIENEVDRPLNWAVYFCDFLRYQNPLPEGESLIVSDANVAYKREALESVGSVWRAIFHESAVNNALRAKGGTLVLAPRAVVSQHRLGLRLGSALKERYVWGRSYAATRAGLAGTSRRLFWAVFAPVLPALILSRMALMAFQKGRTIKPFIKAFPLTTALVVTWSFGELVGYVTGRANTQGAQAAEAIASGSQGFS